MKKSIFGWLFVMLAVFILLCAAVSGYYCLRWGEGDFLPLLYTGLTSLLVGLWLRHFGRGSEGQRLTRADSFLIVALTWVVFSGVGMLPFVMYDAAGLDVASAYFETMSGFTTTGSTVMNNIDRMPHGLLLWRSMTQWIGGLGIVVVAFALLPLIEFKNNNVFQAETTGLTLDKIRPRIGDTARRLLLMYAGLTATCALLFWLGPMSLFDAVCHALTTVATGGFSTHQASIGFFHSAYIEYVASLFMILAGINFSLYYYLGVRRARVFFANEEMRVYMFTILLAVVFFCVLFRLNDDFIPSAAHAEHILRTSLFHVSTIISSTGFQAEDFDYMQWGLPQWILTVVIMVIGGCAGSTAGGVKVIRIIVYFKWLFRDFILQLHPRAVTNVKINQQVIPEGLVRRVLGFLSTYALLVVIGVLVFALCGYDVETSAGTMITALSNIGPGTGQLGPAYTFAALPAGLKWMLSFYMLVGRLEIFTVFIIFMPSFWAQKKVENGMTTSLVRGFHFLLKGR